ncbi:amidohydrolase family protein [Enterovibrio nigricans]|uniref:Predicted metal-dependent hydrolase, TIM-barrel fold n=1 Tax=Enterovibrio nigricans DSM 22720 TaxID=1121868 RepID=A0A1T4VL56_9GAMM|nr:amidohydrolase family protein [Enterovibrio nigricans]PKF49433.1 amidohydrolase [Enterovibrio nigricans]SKA65666.1 Predicted metal-dependent hydrolase, TIM-barrel fold [Enterovibrio nigricans DSM 22720]
MQIIDPHLHLFSLSDGNYGWLKPENAPFWPDKSVICRDFHEHDLQLDAPFKLSGFVHVEAGFDNEQPWREIEWLESSCAMPFKSIACVDLTLDCAVFTALLGKLTQYQSVIGVRHILDEDAEHLLSQASVQKNLAVLASESLIFEAQFDVKDKKAVDAFISTASTHASLQFVLNHAGFPPAANSHDWQLNIRRLAQHDNFWVKASGWEMSDRDFPLTDIVKSVDILLKSFGEHRVMLASNFPLTLFRASYGELWRDYLSLPYNEKTLNKLCIQNAMQCYGF